MEAANTSLDADDLAVVTSLLRDLAHEHLAIAIDYDGRPAVILEPSVAGRLHFLAREAARRSMALAVKVEAAQ